MRKVAQLTKVGKAKPSKPKVGTAAGAWKVSQRPGPRKVGKG